MLQLKPVFAFALLMTSVIKRCFFQKNVAEEWVGIWDNWGKGKKYSGTKNKKPFFFSFLTRARDLLYSAHAFAFKAFYILLYSFTADFSTKRRFNRRVRAKPWRSRCNGFCRTQTNYLRCASLVTLALLASFHYYDYYAVFKGVEKIACPQILFSPISHLP